MSVPFRGCAVTLKVVSMSPSMSLPVRVIDTAVSSSVAMDWALATGASLTGLTVTETVAAADWSEASLTVKLKLSMPWKSVFGV